MKLLVIVIASILPTTTAIAQPALKAPRALCWAGRPLPECRAWIVTEFGVEKGVASTRSEPSDYDFEQNFVLTLGRMANTSPGTAAGFTASLYFADRGAGFRAETRRRWWNSPRVAIDGSAGFASQQIPRMTFGAPTRGNGVTASAAIEYEWLAATLRSDVLRGGGRTVGGISAGIRAGGRAGTAAAAIFTAGILAIIALIVSSGGA